MAAGALGELTAMGYVTSQRLRDQAGQPFPPIAVAVLLSETEPEVAGRVYQVMVAFQTRMTELFRERLGYPVGAIEPRIIAASVTATWFVAVYGFADVVAGTTDPPSTDELGLAGLTRLLRGHGSAVGGPAQPLTAVPSVLARSGAVPAIAASRRQALMRGDAAWWIDESRILSPSPAPPVASATGPRVAYLVRPARRPAAGTPNAWMEMPCMDRHTPGNGGTAGVRQRTVTPRVGITGRAQRRREGRGIVRNVWKGLVIGGLTGAAAGAAHRISGNEGHRVPRRWAKRWLSMPPKWRSTSATRWRARYRGRVRPGPASGPPSPGQGRDHPQPKRRSRRGDRRECTRPVAPSARAREGHRGRAPGQGCREFQLMASLAHDPERTDAVASTVDDPSSPAGWTVRGRVTGGRPDPRSHRSAAPPTGSLRPEDPPQRDLDRSGQAGCRSWWCSSCSSRRTRSGRPCPSSVSHGSAPVAVHAADRRGGRGTAGGQHWSCPHPAASPAGRRTGQPTGGRSRAVRERTLVRRAQQGRSIRPVESSTVHIHPGAGNG